MTKLCILTGATVVGWLGWAAGEWIGCEFIGCFLLSGIGSLAGVYAGWKLARKIDAG